MIKGIGFYGKLPAFGDFIRRNITPVFVDRWDNWLMRAMENASWQLQDSWQQLYLQAPVWRFYLSEGVLDENAFLGITMPSVDRVGRLYPFTLVVELEGQDNPLLLLTGLETELLRLEDFIIALLDEKAIDPEHLLEQVVQEISPALTGQMMPRACLSPLTASEMFSCELTGLQDLDTAVSAMACYFIRQQTLKYSFWWSCGSQRRAPQFRVFDNMPPPEAYISFLEREPPC
ncbi:type VI secretion system-associated protein TagF [Thalassomonas viridans]|uniref:Type VI secretion system-associated protein TagF n=1 Tax=Thalassomonas viridans TaxID=137584 RepID=A0AAE9YX25_9GAMM|nr:type VI secretion system-associated protein TagF [Thalassomonas viridans]WDE02876.1 type VI secretion system-associated protein TagF [Thalassomonas viridans]